MTNPLLSSLIRSLLVATCALGLCSGLVRWIDQSRSVSSFRIRTLLAVGPLFVPELLIGFHYRLTAARWSAGAPPWVLSALTELLYAGLQIVRAAAVGTAIVQLLPGSRVGPEALHTLNLATPRMDRRLARRLWWRLRLTGSWTPWIVAWCLMALLTFQEFETAALLQIGTSPASWTVSLFDAQAARQPLADSLRMLVVPVLCELLLLAPAVGLWMLTAPESRDEFPLSPRSRTARLRTVSLLSPPPLQPTARPGDVPESASSADLATHASRSRRSDPENSLRADPASASDAFRTTAGWLADMRPTAVVLPGIILFLIWPCVVNAAATLAGLRLLLSRAQLIETLMPIGTSTVFAGTSAVLAMLSAEVLLTTRSAADGGSAFGQSGAMLLRLLAVLPGLCGSLVLSLLLLAAFQWPPLRMLYDTWLPMVLGQSFAVFPRAMVIVWLLRQTSSPAGLHSAQLLKSAASRVIRRAAAAIEWRLTTGRRLLGLLVILHWCFWDVTVASILRPIDPEPIVTRLYNEMHYGRTEALLSQSLLAMLVPLLLCGLTMLISRGAAVAFRDSGSVPRTRTGAV